MKRPNILLLFPDQWRGDWMPEINEALPLELPNIRKLMQKGAVFVNCSTPSPLCAPARACLASGKIYENCGVHSNAEDYPLQQRTFYSVLKEQGYHVGGTGKFDLHKKTHFWGLDGWIDALEILGFTDAVDNEGKMDGFNSGKETPQGPYMKFLHDNGYAALHIADYTRRKQEPGYTGVTPLPDDAYCDNWITNRTLEMLDRFDDGRPWFLQVNFTGPHAPFDVTARMKQGQKNKRYPPAAGSEADPEKINEQRQNYAAMMENIDRNIGRILDKLKNKGQVENTVVFFCADHGDMMGDKGMYGKANPYRGSVRIPLVISGNDIVPGTREQLVQLQDLAATIVELAGAVMPEADGAISMMPLLKDLNAAWPRRWQVAALNQWRMITNGSYKAVMHNGVLTEVYDLVDDAFELKNIIGKYPQMEQTMLEAFKGGKL